MTNPDPETVKLAIAAGSLGIAGIKAGSMYARQWLEQTRDMPDYTDVRLSDPWKMPQSGGDVPQKPKK